MKRSYVVPAFLLLLALGLAAGTVLWKRVRTDAAAPPAREFNVRGVVRGVDTNENTLRVEHEEIPGYMEAMTMALPVKEPALLDGLRRGDAITFLLKVTDDDSWIARVEKRSSGAPASASSIQAGANSLTARVQSGEKVPEFTVLDQNGRARSLGDFRGKAVLLNFIYTRCPLPNFCPLLSRKFAELQQALSTNIPGRFQLVSVTIDPGHDTPEALKRYAATWTQDERSWIFGTPAPDELRRIADTFGLVYERNAAGQIDHDLRTALIDPQGRLVHVWKSNFWKTDEVLQRVREL